MTDIDLRAPETVEALRRENAKRPITSANGNIGLRGNEMTNIDIGKVTRSWIKDGVKLQETDELYLAVGDEDDYHSDNKLRATELQQIRDGEVIARIWWAR